MADAKPSAIGQNTTAANVDQHLGKVPPVRKKRRTKAEMARDRALEEKMKKEKAQQQAESVSRIAELEDQMAIDDAGAEGAHPRNQKGSLS